MVLCSESDVFRFCLFRSASSLSCLHNGKFKTVVLVASGFGYWSLDGYLEDMLRTARADTRTQMIVLVYNGRMRKSHFESLGHTQLTV